MSKLAAITSKPTLREYAQGAAQRAVMPIANFLAPVVRVSTSVGQYKKYNEKHRFAVPDTRRALGGRAVQVAFDATDETYNCKPNAIDYPIDELEKLETAALENIAREGADIVAEIAALAHERDVITKALAAAGNGTDKNFTSDSVDPIAEIDAAIMTVIKAARYGSLMGVGVLFGATTWTRTKNNKNVRARYLVGGSKSIVTPAVADIGSMLLANPECQVSLMVQDTAPAGVAPSISFLSDEDVLIFARSPNPTRRDPSFMKTFRLDGAFMAPRSYQRDDGRVEVLAYDWSEDVKVTNSTAVVRLNAKNTG